MAIKVIGEIIENNGVVGYTLQEEETGQIRKIKTDAIIGAMKTKGLIIKGLKITGNRVEMVKSVESTGKAIKQVEHSEQVEQHRQVKQLNTSTQNTQPTQHTNNTNPAYKEMKELVDKLNKARAVYEQGEDEILTNFEYDALYDKLLALEKSTGIVLANSPTHNVGYEVVSELKKIEHSSKMLSLDKTKSIESLSSWLNGNDGVLSWKLDGLTVVLTYDNGKLIQAVTRGNGTVGEDVTNNVKTFKNVPTVIAYKGKLVLRGEAVISYTTFNKINSTIVETDKLYKNPRNLCSGSVRQLDSSVTAQRNVKWYAFEVIGYSDNKADLIFSNDYNEQLNKLEELGFETVERLIVNSANIADSIAKFKGKIEHFDIPSDGLVLTYRNRKYGISLGTTAKFPRHSIAFKWQDEVETTTLQSIEWQVGRSGVITPVAVFKPVELEGTTVTRASLHNISVMLDTLGKPYVGQKIGVYKANMIIPAIAWGEKAT